MENYSIATDSGYDHLTPGPWRWVFLPTAGNYFLLGNNGDGPITHSAPDSADGRLKQAAPALLEALTDLLDWVNVPENEGRAVSIRGRAWAAIAAARGEA